MKKFLLVSVLAWVLVLTWCSQQKWLSQDELFEKKKECANHKDEMQKQLLGFSTLGGIEKVLEVDEIFYSPVKNTCLYTVKLIRGNPVLVSQDMDDMISASIMDYFSNSIVFSISKDLLNINSSGFNKQLSPCSKQFLSDVNEVVSIESKQKVENYTTCMNDEYKQLLKELKWE